MIIFSKKFLPVALAMAAVCIPFSARADAKVCNGSGDCFEFRCLPSEVNKLEKVPEIDVCLKRKGLVQSSPNRATAIKIMGEDCQQIGGTIKDSGGALTCSFPLKQLKTKAGCEGYSGVWDGGVNGGGCIPKPGPKK